MLTYDTTPTPLSKWTYKAIYRVSEAQVGLRSYPVTITGG